MPCISVPHIGLGDLGISFPSIPVLPPIQLPGLSLCCTLQPPPIDMESINALVALALSLIPGLGKLVSAIMPVLMKFIAIFNKILDQLTFRCPLNG